MEKFYLHTEIRVGGKTIPFISNGPITLSGCYTCGEYEGLSQKTQGVWLDYFDDRFLCLDCLGKNSPYDKITRDLYVRILDSSFINKKLR
jgi:hypothetical protein